MSQLSFLQREWAAVFQAASKAENAVHADPRTACFWRETVMPTVRQEGPYRMYFFSHEPNEPPHVHLDRDSDSAKIWLRFVSVARNRGFSSHELRRVDADRSPDSCIVAGGLE